MALPLSAALARVEVPFVQGSFRDLHGLPTEAKVPLPDPCLGG